MCYKPVALRAGAVMIARPVPPYSHEVAFWHDIDYLCSAGKLNTVHDHGVVTVALVWAAGCPNDSMTSMSEDEAIRLATPCPE